MKSTRSAIIFSIQHTREQSEKRAAIFTFGCDSTHTPTHAKKNSNTRNDTPHTLYVRAIRNPSTPPPPAPPPFPLSSTGGCLGRERGRLRLLARKTLEPHPAAAHGERFICKLNYTYSTKLFSSSFDSSPSTQLLLRLVFAFPSLPPSLPLPTYTPK